MSIRQRGIPTLSRALESCYKGRVTTVRSTVARLFSGSSPFNISELRNNSTHFVAIGADWKVEPISRGTGSSLSIVRVSCGNTVVLAQVLRRDGSGPLPPRFSHGVRGVNVHVDYKENYFATGKFPPVFDRREMSVSSREQRISLQIRKIMESVIVPEAKSVNDIWIKLSVLSADEACDGEIVGINAASVALALSPEISWYGPVGAVRVIFDKDKNNNLSPVPSIRYVSSTKSEDCCDGDESQSGSYQPGSMVVVCSKNGFISIRGDSEELPSNTLKDGIELGYRTIRDTLLDYQLTYAGGKAEERKDNRVITLQGADPAAARRMQHDINGLVSRYYEVYSDSPGSFNDYVQKTIKPKIKEICTSQGRWRSETSRVKGSGCTTMEDIDHVSVASAERLLKDQFWSDGKRPDGRQLLDILSDSVNVGNLPSCHGSSIYSVRGTSVATAVTCGSLSSIQNVENTIFGLEMSRITSLCTFTQDWTRTRNRGYDVDASDYIVSTFSRLIPTINEIPFAFRVNTEILSSDGCHMSPCINGAYAALQNLGLMLKKPLGSATVGLTCKKTPIFLDGEEYQANIDEHGTCDKQSIDGYKVLVDPSGIESVALDATFVCSGTGSKLSSWAYLSNRPVDVTLEILCKMIDIGLKSQKSRLKNMGEILKCQNPPQSRFGEISVHPATLPKLRLDRGAILENIEATTGGKIHLYDNGLLKLFAPSPERYGQLEDAIMQAAGANLVPGRVYKAKVTTIKDFGAFVELPGSDIEALLHISEISSKRITSVEDELKISQEVDVLFQGRDKLGNLRVSTKAVSQEKKK